MQKMDEGKICKLVMMKDSDMSDINYDSDIENDSMAVDEDDTTMNVGEPDSSSNNEDSTNNTEDNNFVTAQVTVQHPGPLRLRDLRRSYAWRSIIQQQQLFPFAGIQGPTCNVVVNDVGCPYKFFKLFFMASLWNLLVMETNRHALQYLAKTTFLPKSRFQKWTPITLEEMENFLGLVLLTKII